MTAVVFCFVCVWGDLDEAQWHRVSEQDYSGCEIMACSSQDVSGLYSSINTL